MSWHAHAHGRLRETGKFRAHAKMGTDKKSNEVYREWHFSLVAHQTCSGMKRIRYAVSICDPQMKRVEYLRDFSNIQQATAAAKQWIDRVLRPRLPSRSSSSSGPAARPPFVTEHSMSPRLLHLWPQAPERRSANTEIAKRAQRRGRPTCWSSSESGWISTAQRLRAA